MLKENENGMRICVMQNIIYRYIVLRANILYPIFSVPASLMCNMKIIICIYVNNMYILYIGCCECVNFHKV